MSKLSFASNLRAKTLHETDNFVKLISDEKNEKILGCHILHANASMMINQISVCTTNGVSPEGLAYTIHGHPDLNELIFAAALDFCDKPISGPSKN